MVDMNEGPGCGRCSSKKDCSEPVKGCGKCCVGGCHIKEVSLTEAESDFLKIFYQIPFLPLCRYRSMQTEPFPVYLSGEKESADEIRSTGQVLKSLENRGLITLDYDKPLSNFDYSDYKNPALIKALFDTPAEGKPFCPDPELEFGSVALTPLGMDVLDSFDMQ